MKRLRFTMAFLLLALLLVPSSLVMAETETIEWQEMPYGAWMAGTWTGVNWNEETGKYEGVGPGMGYILVFNFDGTHVAISAFFEHLYVTGKYEVEGDIIRFLARTAQESKDGGLTWEEAKPVADESLQWVFGHDEQGTYLLMAEKGAEPPFVHGINAFRYNQVPDVPIF
ncbi:MAG: hypothetical protein GX249_00650 [Firmicutes bacterium]|nr:hypothetical protein [Bacillota bacterium]